MRQLHADGTTIFLSSHLLAEVEQLCSRIGMLDRGRLVLEDSLESLQASTGRTVIVTPDVGAAAGLLGRAVEERVGERLLVRAGDPAGVNARLVAAGVRVRELGPERPSLEDVIARRTSERLAGEVPR